MSIKKPSFIVDLSCSMVITNNEFAEESKGQKLFCSCGNVQKFNSKLVRNIIKNYDELTEDSESAKSITCKSCNLTYSSLEKLYLLEPGLPEIYSIDYRLELKGEDNFSIIRVKGIAEYLSSNETLVFSESVDILKFNIVEKSVLLKSCYPFITNDLFTRQDKTGISIADSNKEKSAQSNYVFEHEIDITNVQYLEEFFSYSDSVNYSGFENILNSLNIIKPNIKDLEKFDSVYFIDFIKSKCKINKEEDGLGNVKYYQNVDSGFGDGKIIKRNLNLGDYLFNTMNSYKLLVSIISFENASCIIHTKGYSFFKSWTESKFICKPEVYLENKATNPHLIMQVSMTKSKEGESVLLKNLIDDTKCSNKVEPSELKISSTIYNSIKVISQLKTLNESFVLKIINKEQFEFLFQNYESNRVYGILSALIKSSRGDTVALCFKNLKHILDCNIDGKSEKSNDFMTIYKDTLRVIDLLDVKDKLIFKCKNYKQLKDLHDDYSSRYSAMRDAKKAEFYLKSVSPFLKLNSQIGDIKFEVVDTSERLNLEGLQMNHCIYTYLNRICEKEYIAINLTHVVTKERATAGFVRKGDSLQLEQIKGYYNSRATQEMISTTTHWCNENGISIKNTYSSDLQPDKSRERAMPGQMSEEKLFKLRKENGGVLDSKLQSNKKQENHLVKSFIKKIFK